VEINQVDEDTIEFFGVLAIMFLTMAFMMPTLMATSPLVLLGLMVSGSALALAAFQFIPMGD
jgi:hypothetical protein